MRRLVDEGRGLRLLLRANSPACNALATSGPASRCEAPAAVVCAARHGGAEAALDLLAELAEELCFEMRLAPGDIQLLNNHVVYHARTPFTDDPAAGRVRLLYRLWLAMANSRPLPADHAVLWRDVAPGALRGGIGQTPVSPC